ncbi:MAG: DUF4364 family protein [Clostridia bacterium]|nr:DUF4364 family protein [Clostridia bacterium]
MASQLKKEDEIKIFILYLLDKIGYPLDYPSIGSIMMQDGIVNFFDFAQCFFALVDAGHIREIVTEKPNRDCGEENSELCEDGTSETEADPDIDYEPATTVLYEVTDTGRQVARVLSDSLMVTVREKSYRSALRHLSFERQGAYVNHSYRPDGDGFLVNCSIKDHKGTVMDLTVRADSEYQLRRMLNNYSERPEVVFRGVVALLSGDVNYLFED